MQARVGGPVDPGFDRCGGLGQSHAFELGGELVDLPEEFSGPDGVHRLLHRLAGLSVDAGSCGGASKWGGRPVVAFGDFGPVALLEDDLLAGRQVVREDHVECPDLVQDRGLSRRVEA